MVPEKLQGHGRVGMSAALVAALKRKEPTAFEQLLAPCWAMLYRVALCLMGQEEEAEDVLLQTRLTGHEKIDTFEERSALMLDVYPGVSSTRKNLTLQTVLCSMSITYDCPAAEL